MRGPPCRSPSWTATSMAPGCGVSTTCGLTDGPKPRHVREGTCAVCGVVHGRDHHVAINVRMAAGLAASACGALGRPGAIPAQRDVAGNSRPNPVPRIGTATIEKGRIHGLPPEEQGLRRDRRQLSAGAGIWPSLPSQDNECAVAKAVRVDASWKLEVINTTGRIKQGDEHALMRLAVSK